MIFDHLNPKTSPGLEFKILFQSSVLSKPVGKISSASSAKSILSPSISLALFISNFWRSGSLNSKQLFSNRITLGYKEQISFELSFEF
jgi:hypothetical protein